jgi:hypothetical protein
MNRFQCIASITYITLAAAGVRPHCASAQAPLQAVNNFVKLFPNPTGLNGYEDLVRAGDILQNSPVWQALEHPAGEEPPTLAMKRRAIADPIVRAALEALRAGLQKPITSPHAKLDDETVFPELAPFRSLARLLGHEIYVQLADGRVTQAIETLGLALKFGYVIQQDTVLSGLVAIAVDAIAIRPIGDHLDQLSVRDCDKLLAVAREWLELPDPAIAIIQKEKKLAMETFNKYKADPPKLLKLLDPGVQTTETRQRFDELHQTFAANPNAATGIFEDSARILSGQYDQAIENVNRPAWDRKPYPPVDQSTPGGFLAAEFGGGQILTRILDRYTREQAQVQLLGIHAAIHRRIWELNSPPDSLIELKLGKLIIDPFSGRPFEYKRLEGSRYTLSSIGPIDRDAKPGAPAGARTPVSIGPIL